MKQKKESKKEESVWIDLPRDSHEMNLEGYEYGKRLREDIEKCLGFRC